MERAFNKKLKKLMIINNKTQHDLIIDLGFSSPTISSWCNGWRVPRIDKMKMLANYFNVPLGYFFDTETSNNENTLLTEKEFELIADYRKLNDEGKEKLHERVKELTELTKYKNTKEKEHLIVQAAHNDFAYDEEERKKIEKDLEKLVRPKFFEEPKHLIVDAAHERTDIEVTDEMRKHDDDIMNDENF